MAEVNDVVISLGISIIECAKKIQQLGDNWYKTTAEWKEFPGQVEQLQDKVDVWKKKAGPHKDLSSNSSLIKCLRDAKSPLEDERRKLERRAAFSRSECWPLVRTTLFPATLGQSIQAATDGLSDVPAMVSDSDHVPLELETSREDKIRNSLDNLEGPAVILLHGGAGEEKSALARKMAEHYNNQENHKFDHVVFLKCGPEAKAEEKVSELRQRLGTSEVQAASEDDERSPSMPVGHVFQGPLAAKKILLVLDDVSDQNFLGRILQQFDNSAVKCLVTSQLATLCLPQPPSTYISFDMLRDIGQQNSRKNRVGSSLNRPDLEYFQPGPWENPVQCFVKRDKTTSTYRLYIPLSAWPDCLNEPDPSWLKLAARKVRCATSTDYIISSNANDILRGSNTHVGTLRSNFLRTKFTVFDTQPIHSGVGSIANRARKLISSKKGSPNVPPGSYNVAHVAYEQNVLGRSRPRRMQCTLHTISTSAMNSKPVGSVPRLVESPVSAFSFQDASVKSKSAVADSSAADSESRTGSRSSKDGPLVLKNNPPLWHEQLQCWCLNFRGRVTVASAKSFQLVAASEPSQVTSAQTDRHKKVLVQFGKIGKDTYTMDYRYPLSALQAFAICLSSFNPTIMWE